MCRRCSECVGMSHHWMAEPLPPDEPDEYLPGDYACKHCEQRGDSCDTCAGDGCLGGNEAEQCPDCNSEGVIPLPTDPLQIAALTLLDLWDDWDADARQAAQQAQDSRVYRAEMAERIAKLLARVIPDLTPNP